MILILACHNCRRTSAVRAVVDIVDDVRKETWLLWNCVRCDKHHQWLIPGGRSLEDTARQSLKSSLAYGKVGERQDIYQRLNNSSPEERGKILFGELIWWWRNELPRGPKLEEVAEAAQITKRQWLRIEAGESLPHQKNLVRVVRAVDGVMDQAYLVTDSGKIWKNEMERRLADEEARICMDEHLEKSPEGYTLQSWESPDVEVALQAFRRVSPREFDVDHFLFYAYTVHQEYWGRGTDGTIIIDDNRDEVIPVLKKLFDLFERCKDRQGQYRIVHLMARGAKFYMPKARLISLVIHFIRRSFTSAVKEDDTRSRMGEEWTHLSPIERLALILFDLIDPQYQPRFIEACQQRQGSTKGIDHWLSE